MSIRFNSLNPFRVSSNLFSLLFSPSARSLQVPIPHVPQTENWDCGVACICMILLWINGMREKNSLLSDLKDSQNWKQPLWTIEIFKFLKEYELDVVYMTTFIGIGGHHSQIKWYSDRLEEDINKIDQILKVVQENNWIIEQVHRL